MIKKRELLLLIILLRSKLSRWEPELGPGHSPVFLSVSSDQISKAPRRHLQHDMQIKTDKAPIYILFSFEIYSYSWTQPAPHI